MDKQWYMKHYAQYLRTSNTNSTKNWMELGCCGISFHNGHTISQIVIPVVNNFNV